MSRLQFECEICDITPELAPSFAVNVCSYFGTTVEIRVHRQLSMTPWATSLTTLLAGGSLNHFQSCSPGIVVPKQAPGFSLALHRPCLSLFVST